MTKRLQIARGRVRGLRVGRPQRRRRALADDFTFYSPPDPGIDREAYFERCWPNCAELDGLRLRAPDRARRRGGRDYEATRTDGTRFRNTEVLTFDGEHLTRAEVYFGWDL